MVVALFCSVSVLQKDAEVRVPLLSGLAHLLGLRERHGVPMCTCNSTEAFFPGFTGMPRFPGLFSGEMPLGMMPQLAEPALAEGFGAEGRPRPRQTVRRGRGAPAVRPGPQPGAVRVHHVGTLPRPARSPRGRYGSGVPAWGGWSHVEVPGPPPPPEIPAPPARAPPSGGAAERRVATVVGRYARQDSGLHCGVSPYLFLLQQALSLCMRQGRSLKILHIWGWVYHRNGSAPDVGLSGRGGKGGV
jgi:hypothetical protein